MIDPCSLILHFVLKDKITHLCRYRLPPVWEQDLLQLIFGLLYMLCEEYEFGYHTRVTLSFVLP